MSDWFEGGGSGSPVDVVALFDSGVPLMVAQCVESGALVSIGTTSDGGALGITVTLDGRWRREYFRESEAATQWLMEARDAVANTPKRPSAPSGTRQRVRRSA